MTTRFPTGLWAVALIASVLLNGLVIGAVVAGAASGLRVTRDGADVATVRPMRVFDGRLPDAVRDDAMQRMRERAEESRPLFEAAREANIGVMRALSADIFDEAAVRAAFARAEAAGVALDRHANEATMSLFANLSQETRARLVERRRFGAGDQRGGWGRDDWGAQGDRWRDGSRTGSAPEPRGPGGPSGGERR